MISQSQNQTPTSPNVARNKPHARKDRQGDVRRSRLLPILGPAGLSLVLHSLMIMLLTLVTWAVGGEGDGLLGEFEAKVVASSDPPDSLGGFQFHGATRSDQPESMEVSIQDLASLLAQDESLQMAPLDVGDSGLKAIAVSELSRSDVVGTSVSGADGTTSFSEGLGDRDLAGGGPVGSLWGVGKGQQARSIVYVMDRSGSMSDTMDSLQRELMRAIGSLEPDQLFNVIWFNEGKATVWSARLKKATIENKRDAFNAIKQVVPAGQTEPMNAIRRSLAFRPDVMFLLSDGDFGEDNKRIQEMIKSRNRGGRTIINTILFVYDTMGEGERVLRAIAEMNGGTYKHVTEQDIRRR